MNKQITKYLLLAPLSYIAYCYYESEQEKLAKKPLISSHQSPENLNYQYGRFVKCQSTLELAHILKKSLKTIRQNITWASNHRSEIEDCEVIDTNPENNALWNSHYHTRATYRINKNNYQQNRKQGFYNIICWSNVEVKQQLKLQKTGSQQQIIKEMLDGRQSKCFQIAKHSKPSSNEQFQKYFLQCYQKSQVVARLLEKELSQIQLIKNYKKYL